MRLNNDLRAICEEDVYINSAWKNCSRKWFELLFAIYEGKVKTYYDTNQLGLLGIRFELMAIKELRQKILFPQGQFTNTVYEVMRVLSVGRSTLKIYRDNCLLCPLNIDETSETKWIYSVSDVSEFEKHYIKVPEVAKIIGRSPRTVLSWINQRILKPNSGFSINGSHEYLFNREYIVNWRNQRLLVKEVMEHLGIKRRTLEDWVSKGKLIPIEEMGSHPLWFDHDHVLVLHKNVKKQQ